MVPQGGAGCLTACSPQGQGRTATEEEKQQWIKVRGKRGQELLAVQRIQMKIRENRACFHFCAARNVVNLSFELV